MNINKSHETTTSNRETSLTQCSHKQEHFQFPCALECGAWSCSGINCANLIKRSIDSTKWKRNKMELLTHIATSLTIRLRISSRFRYETLNLSLFTIWHVSWPVLAASIYAAKNLKYFNLRAEKRDANLSKLSGQVQRIVPPQLHTRRQSLAAYSFYS